jgi:hypothetical protein
MFSMERQAASAPGEPIFWSFQFRRIFRIYPLSILIVLVVAVLRLPVGPLRQGVFFPVNLHWPGLIKSIPCSGPDPHGIESCSAVELAARNADVPGSAAALPDRETDAKSYSCFDFVGLGSSCRFIFATSGASRIFRLVRLRPVFSLGRRGVQVSSPAAPEIAAWIWPAALGLITWVYESAPAAQRSWRCCLALGIVLPQFREISNAAFRKISSWSRDIPTGSI